MINTTLTSLGAVLIIVSYANAEDTTSDAGITCEVATTIATRAYNRTQSAFEANNISAAIMYSRSFWDVKDLLSNCSQLDTIASTLTKHNILANTPIPQDAPVPATVSASIFGVIPEACKNGGCKVIITSPGSGVSSGAEAPKAYLLDAGKTTELKMINKAVLYKNDAITH